MSHHIRTAAVALCAALVTAVGGTGAHAVPLDESGPLMNYVVNTRANHGQVQKAERAIRAAGGTVVQTWEQIGVIIAQSTNPGFRSDVRAGGLGNAVESVGATRTAAVSEGPANATGEAVEVAPAPDPRENEQWDMMQIKADRAHAVTDGSSQVLVGIVDSGVDDAHPDLAPNFDAANSVNCVRNGRPDTTPGGWRNTTSSHGTHVAGTVAAARNGIGIVGVAPGVRIASVKVTNDDGFIYPEYAICGFMWAAAHRMDITNHSYFIDPWVYWCDDDGDQGAVQESVRRAVEFANGSGSLAVGSAGNSNHDLNHKTTDSQSPNDTTPVSRQITNDCLHMPTESPGVVTVASTTQAGPRSSFSNFGEGEIDLAAPGSRILSTIPDNRYALFSGTSMASPHVAGVAALMKSAHPDWGPAQIRRALRAQADDRACPTAPADPRCTGTTAYNSFFGEGLADALDAVTP